MALLIMAHLALYVPSASDFQPKYNSEDACMQKCMDETPQTIWLAGGNQVCVNKCYKE